MSFSALQALWSASVAVVPLALIVIFLVTLMRCRPATRHALWVAVLLSLLAPLLLAIAGVPVGAISATVASHARTAITTVSVTTRAATLEPQRASIPQATQAAESVADELPQAPRAVAEDAQATTRQTPRREAPVVARPLISLPDRTTTRDAPVRTPPQEAWAPARRRAESPKPSAPALADVPLNSDPLPVTLAADISPEPVTALLISRPEDAPAPLISRPEDAPAPRRASVVDAGTTIAGTTMTQARYGIAAWMTWLANVRDAMVTLPPIPPVVWVIGVIIVVVGWLTRSARSRHILKSATPAPEEIVRLVERESVRIGLRRAPQTMMVTARISPSVLCDIRPRLAIPVDLWEQFDDASKRAAIVHELAHLRRRDHWVMWLETIVGAIYWWHPVVWWVRKRLREEADLCCDAWVTTLMPRERRAYAEALVLTKAYLSCPGPREQRVGIGMASAHAKKFARRVTMVMTQRGTPRMSAWGVALASAITLAGLVAAPTIACPPDKEKKDKVAQSNPVAVTAPRAPRAPRADAAPRAPRAIAERPAPRANVIAPDAPSGSTFEQHMNDRGGDRIDDLERRIERLEAKIDRLLQMMGDQGAQRGSSAAPSSDGATSERLYVLPEGKLSELTALMVRQDVPILVSPRDDGLIVYATPSQHRAFSHFITLIHPEHADSARADARDEARDNARVQREQALLQRDMRERQQYDVARAQYRDQIQAMSVQADELRRASEDQRRQTKQLSREMERVLQQSEKAYQKAEQCYDKAEELQDQAEELMEEAEENDSDHLRAKAEQTYARAREYESKANAYESEAHALESQAENLEDAADQVEDQADAFEDQAEEFEDRAEELEDRLEELMEELKELMEELEEEDDEAEN